MMNRYILGLMSKSIAVGLIIWLTLGTGLVVAQLSGGAAGNLTLSLQPALDSDGDIKATTITSAELLSISGAVVKTATITGGTAQFDLSGVTAGDYFIRVNGMADDLVPARIDDPTKAISQFVGQKLRVTVIGDVDNPTYRIDTYSRGQGEHSVVGYSDGAVPVPERYAYVLLSLKTSPQELEIRVLGTAALLTSFSPGSATHPSTAITKYPSSSTWMVMTAGSTHHSEDYNGTDSECNICHVNMDTKPARFQDVTTGNGWCYRCHYGKGGVDNGFIDTTPSGQTPVPTVTIQPSPTATKTAVPTATATIPAFEAFLAVSAVLAALLLVRRR